MSNWVREITKKGFYFVRQKASDDINNLSVENFRFGPDGRLTDNSGVEASGYMPSCRFKKINVTDAEAIA